MSAPSERDRRILARRAELLARPLVTAARADDEVEVALCVAGSEIVGFPLQHLREIVPCPSLTPLPFAPRWMLGVAQVRGSLLSVIDLALLLGGGAGTAQHVVVIEAPEGPIGFAVDEVRSCRRVSPSALRREAADRPERSASLGVTSDLVVVLDVPRLLSLCELRIG